MYYYILTYILCTHGFSKNNFPAIINLSVLNMKYDRSLEYDHYRDLFYVSCLKLTHDLKKRHNGIPLRETSGLTNNAVWIFINKTRTACDCALTDQVLIDRIKWRTSILRDGWCHSRILDPPWRWKDPKWKLHFDRWSFIRKKCYSDFTAIRHTYFHVLNNSEIFCQAVVTAPDRVVLLIGDSLVSL